MSRDVRQLHPWLQYKIGLLKKECAKKGLRLGIGECFRTVAEQDALYAKGRTKPGRRVTNARGKDYNSQHQFGIAVDVFQNIKGKEYDAAFLRKVAKIAKSKKVGLAWGGDWKSFVDTPHFYLGKWGSTTKQLKAKYGLPDNFKREWRKRVVGTKKGLNIWNKAHTKVLIKKVPNGRGIDIMYTKLFPWGRMAKVKYKNTVGWMRSKYLK